jgi:stage II sporulation protein D
MKTQVDAGRVVASLLPLFLLLCNGCSAPPLRISPEGGEARVRVCIADKVEELELVAQGDITLRLSGTQRFIQGGGRLRCALATDGNIQLHVGEDEAFDAGAALRLYHHNPASHFDFQKRGYGDTLLIVSDGSRLYMINVLPLERYLCGVVPNEIGRNRKRNEIEAVRAQAVLARTYAVNKILLPLTRLFDVYADTRDQVFGGLLGEDALCTQAVEDTRGIVLERDGALADSYYHSTCGGHTEAPAHVWRHGATLPQRAGVSDREGKRSYCRISPSFRWSEFYTRTQLEELLRTFLPSADDTPAQEDIPTGQWYLLDINILKRAPSGRVQTIQIVMGNRMHQRSYYVHGDRIRWGIRRPDGAALRSTLFDVYLKRDAKRWITQIRIDGGGNGHGVGLCQWGAIGRARAGHTFRSILEYYYPGSGLVALY